MEREDRERGQRERERERVTLSEWTVNVICTYKCKASIPIFKTHNIL